MVALAPRGHEAHEVVAMKVTKFFVAVGYTEGAMAYRSAMEARIAKKTTRAIADFGLIEDGDRVMVGLSGGKDSWTLLQVLDELRQRAPIRFSLVAVNVDSGYKEYKHDLIASTCLDRGWECRIEHTSIGEVMDDLLEANATPCSLCARLRRGVLYRLADEVGATKIALGHHLDDFIETLLLNLFFAGSLKAMPSRLVSDNGEHVVIRPLVYVTEDEARAYARERELPIVGCCCPACGDLSLQRQRVKRLILDMEREHPGVKQSMLKALSNVMPRHLLDMRLNPSGELRDSVALRLQDDETLLEILPGHSRPAPTTDTPGRLKPAPTTGMSGRLPSTAIMQGKPVDSPGRVRPAPTTTGLPTAATDLPVRTTDMIPATDMSIRGGRL